MLRGFVKSECAFLSIIIQESILTVLKDLGLGLFALGLGGSILVIDQNVGLLQLSVILSFVGLFMLAGSFLLVVAFRL